MTKATCVENDKGNYQTVCYYRVEYVTVFISQVVCGTFLARKL